MDNTNTPLSLGERRVRTQFNPSNTTTVDRLKQETAELINECENILNTTDDPEVKRLCSLAMTSYEEAAMWAVKAATASK